jgi:cytoskeletal protein CcmA (bactofilin family)
MFKKTEESEWTRFSRALGGTPATPAADEAEATANTGEESPTLAQLPPAETQAYTPPPPPPAPPAPEAPAPTYTPPPAPAAAAPLSVSINRQSGPGHDESVIGEGASIEGTVRSEKSIRIIGAVQGEIESRQRVVVEESARVQARITAEHVTVLGEVNGSIECSGRVEIASSARVIGEVTAGTLVIQEGAFFEGALKMVNTRDAG